MRHDQVEHIEELVRAAVGGPIARDPIIRDSWRRCVAEHGLDPARLKDAYIHPQARLREHQEAMDAFLRVARFGTEQLFRQVAGLGYVLILTDAAGVAVDYIGDATFDNQLRKAGLYRGADWREGLAGTCAVGTCIATGEALTVHQSDHFDGTHIALTCTAAPVFATDGALAAVLDISALQSPIPKSSQHLALELVRSYAHRIENANLLNRFRSHWIVQLSASPEFVDVDPDYMLALDDAGRIVGFNHKALGLIEPGRCRARTSGPAAAPLGMAIGDILDVTTTELPRLTRRCPASQRGLRLTASGAVLYALVQEPPRPLPPRFGAQAKTLPARSTIAAAPEAAAAVSDDPTIAAILAKGLRLAEAGIDILLEGETGTGKEFVARLLHQAGRRAGKPFVAVNCAALPESLIEAELFGYEAGAFTGAARMGRRGLVLEAEGGTLFLDEIGDMPLPAQTRLLRVLAEREVMPVGRSRPVAVDLRVIAATHRDLGDLVRQGRFREDLFFRLGGAVFRLPPLRQRQDFDPLVDRLLARGAGGARLRLAAEVRHDLRCHAWPGNIRELINVLGYAAAVATGEEVTRADLPERFGEVPSERAEAASIVPVDAFGAAAALAAALGRRQWNVSAAARDLGLDRSTVHRRIRRLGLVPPHKRH